MALNVVVPTTAIAQNNNQSNTATVTITKYVQGVPATSSNASSTSFLFQSSWSASNLGGEGTGQFTLNSGNSYTATTSPMHKGTSSYTVQELNSNGTAVATECTVGGPRYILSGYTTGDTMAEAASGTPSMTSPNFNPLSKDKYVIVWNRDCTIPVTPVVTPGTQATTSTVSISKYIQGAPATSANASSTSFLLQSSWNATNHGGAGSGQFLLTPSNSYSAMTAPMNNGSSYTVQELNSNGGAVATTCTVGGPRYVLSGYTTGNTWAQAASATSSMSAPNFTNLNGNQYVIVWNRDCTISDSATTTSKVHIMKYVNGALATASSTNSSMFPMMSTWQASNLNNGSTTSGTFYLSGSNMYNIETANMNWPFSYTVSEQTGTTTEQVLPQGSVCAAGKYRLEGYRTSSVSFADATSASLATTSPNWVNTTGHQYVIVYNTLCQSTNDNVPLSVTVTPIKTSGIASNTYEEGWKYMFHVTAPSSETNLSMKFDNWLGVLASSTISAGGNMRISSAQADNGGAHILITSANAYSTPALHMNSDMDLSQAGRQVNVLVEVKIPTGTPNTSYTTNFGVQTLP